MYHLLSVLKLYTEGKRLAIYFGDSQFRTNGILNFIISKIYVEKHLQVL